jgi:hypothetical protein
MPHLRSRRPIATLALYDGGLTLSVSGATTLSAGDIAIAGDAALDTGTFAESGGFLGMSNGTLDVSGQATLSGGGLGVYGGTLQAGSLVFAGGSFGISGGNVTVTTRSAPAGSGRGTSRTQRLRIVLHRQHATTKVLHLIRHSVIAPCGS